MVAEVRRHGAVRRGRRRRLGGVLGADPRARRGAAPTVFCHRDYHAENLIWLAGPRPAAARVGMLDFQDALRAHPAWDFSMLLHDARRDVSPEREAAGAGPLPRRPAGPRPRGVPGRLPRAGRAQRRCASSSSSPGRWSASAGRSTAPSPRACGATWSAAWPARPSSTPLRAWLDANVPPRRADMSGPEDRHGAGRRPRHAHAPADRRSAQGAGRGRRQGADRPHARPAGSGRRRRARWSMSTPSPTSWRPTWRRRRSPEILISDERAGLLETGGGLKRARACWARRRSGSPTATTSGSRAATTRWAWWPQRLGPGADGRLPDRGRRKAAHARLRRRPATSSATTTGALTHRGAADAAAPLHYFGVEILDPAAGLRR